MTAPPIKALAVVGATDTTLTEWTYAPRTLQPEDVDVRIVAAGVCHTDLHQIRQEWGPNDKLRPVVPGHEIVGVVVRAGDKAPFKIGQRVAVGTTVGSCGTCEQCIAGEENYCSEYVDTYMGTHKATKTRTYGGYGERVIVDSKFVFKVPEALPSTTVAPLMCAGITVYQPLRRHFQANASVAVVGIGGLGHLALQFARAIGYKHVVAITSSADKSEAARRFGAHDVLLSSDATAMKAAAKTFDLVLVTASADLPWADYINLLRVAGVLSLVGAVPSGQVHLPAFPFLLRRLEFSGSLTGGTKLIPEMLDVAAKHGVRVAVEVHPLDVRGGNEALDRVSRNVARYRCVLVPKEELAAAQKEIAV